MFIHFLCLCPLRLAIMLNFNTSKVSRSMEQASGEGEMERERDAFYEVCFIGLFVAEPATRPLLCRTAQWDCFKDTNTSFIGSVCHFRTSKTAQKCHKKQHRSIK